MLLGGNSIPDSYWVLPGRLLAGEYPCARDAHQALCKLGWLLEQGVDYWLDLTEADEHGLIAYVPLLLEEAARIRREVTHRRFGIPDMGTPTPLYMRRILDQLDAALESGHTVYLHCYGGIGRTGTVVGCYLVRHGMSGAQALAQIARWRSATPDGWKPSPETRPQTDLVLRWAELD